jgi:hypothetical protein
MARPGLTIHRKFKRACHEAGSLPPPHLLGHLEMIWLAAYEAGDPFIGDATNVELAAGWTGEPGKLFAALLNAGGQNSAGFIEPVEGRPDCYQVHDLFDHAPAYVHNRQQKEAERKKEKTCDQCGSPYRSTETHSRFCGDACKQANYRASKKGDPTPPKAGRVTQRHEPVRNGVTHVTQRYEPPAPAPAPALNLGEVSPNPSTAAAPLAGQAGGMAAREKPDAGDRRLQPANVTASIETTEEGPKLPPGLAALWAAAPSGCRSPRSTRKKCLDVWKRLKLEPHATRIIAAIGAYGRTRQWRDGFAPGLHIWLSNRAFDDMPSSSDGTLQLPPAAPVFSARTLKLGPELERSMT